MRFNIQIILFCNLLLISIFCLRPVFALTTEEEKKIGDKIFFELGKNVEFVRDLDIQNFINRIGHSLLSQAGTSPFKFKFSVIKSIEPNAFAVPGGYIFLTTGILNLSENEHEVAGVIAHEIAHIMGRHITQLIEKSKGLNIVSLAGIIASLLIGGGGKASEAGATMAMALSEAYRLKYTREMEMDADHNSLRYLIKAGYDPNGILNFLRKIKRINLTQSTQIPAYLSTHPSIEDRISLVENLIQVSPKVKGPFRSFTNFNKIQIKAFVEERGPDVSVNHFQSMIDSDIKNLEGYYGLGLSWRKIGRLDKSIEAFQRAQTISPDDPDILRELGISYFLSGRIKEAIEKIESSLSLQKEGEDIDFLALYYLGRCYQEKGDLLKALQNFLKVNREIPDNIDVLFSLGSVCGRIGQKGLSHFYFAKHFKMKGDRKGALLHFKTALEFLEKGSPEREETQKEIKDLTRIE